MCVSKVLCLSLFWSMSFISLQASVISSSDVRLARQSNNLHGWKSRYITRSTALLGRPVKDLLNYASRSNKGLHHLYPQFERLYNQKYNYYMENDNSQTPHGAYHKSFTSIDRRLYGLSQFVLETALACKLFAYGGSIQDKACRSYPKLAIVIGKLAIDKLPNKGNTYTHVNHLDSSNYNPNRGLVLTRALMPLFNARLINDSTINKYWTNTYKRHFASVFRAAGEDINESLRDVFIEKIVSYRFKSDHKDYDSNVDTKSAAFRWAYRNYDPRKIVDLCIERRQRVGNKIARCANNHFMAGFLGRLMIQVMLGSSYRTLDRTYSDFKKLLERGIIRHENEYVMSDRYRTFQKKYSGGPAEKRGIGYSLLQQKFLVMAAEIFIKKRNRNLYTEYHEKLLKSLNFMSRITNTKSTYLSDRRFFRKFFHAHEYTKYVQQETNNKKLNWARNYGFFMVPIKRFCKERGPYLTRYPYLCMNARNRNTRRSLVNTIPVKNANNYGAYSESIYMGPTQLLMIKD